MVNDPENVNKDHFCLLGLTIQYSDMSQNNSLPTLAFMLIIFLMSNDVILIM